MAINYESSESKCDPQDKIQPAPYVSVIKKMMGTYEDLIRITNVNHQIFNILNGDIFREEVDNNVTPPTPSNINDLQIEIEAMRFMILGQVEEFRRILHE